MKNRKENIRQHYIPQLYLRNFADNKGFLYVYNYITEKEYKKRTQNESLIKYYHDVNIDLFNGIIKQKITEKQHVDDEIRKSHENAVAKVIKKLLDKFNVEDFEKVDFIDTSDVDFEKIIDFILIHFIRTPEYRDKIEYLCVGVFRYFNIEIDDLNITENEIIATIHNLVIFGLLCRLNNKQHLTGDKFENYFGQLIDELIILRNQLLDSDLKVFINQTNVPFMTSSSPINCTFEYNPESVVRCFVAPMDGEKAFDTGEASRIEKVHLPLSSNVALMLLDKDFAKQKKTGPSGIKVIDDTLIDIVYNLNLSLASRSPDKIYCCNNEFNELKKMIKNKEPVLIPIF